MDFTTESIRYITFLLLIKLAFIVIVSAMLGNYDYFAKLIFSKRKKLKDRTKIALIMCPTILIGIILRYSANYHPMDFAIPGLFMIGISAGFLPAFFSSIICALVLSFVGGEYWYGIACIVSAVSGSFFFRDDIFETRKRIYHISLGMIPVSLMYLFICRVSSLSSVFVLSNRTIESDVLVVLSDVGGVFLTLFLWRHYKTKLDLIDSAFNLDRAKLAILSSKINPHFLFNTLNTIAAAIRMDANLAREIVFKLSEIMRYVLNTENEFRPIKDEIDFIDNYLDIEKLRFGENRLKSKVEVDNDLSEFEIPTMLIQPLVENAVKHGIAPLSENKGEINIRVSLFRDNNENYIRISVKDNGSGSEISEDGMFFKGIGLANVRDRIKLLYGSKGRLEFESKQDQGFCASIVLPFRR